MTIIETDADWPTRTVVSPFPERMPSVEEYGIQEIVANARCEWMRKYGREPTDLIFGRKACAKFLDLIRSTPAFLYAREWPPKNEFMGMTFHRDWDAEGLKIFGDI